MPSTYSNIKIQLMATGENNTTWGNVTNINLGTALEEAIVGSADVTFASGNVTLTLTDTNASQTARHVRLRCTGVTGGSTRDLIVPAIEKPYLVQNDCLNSIVVKNATGTGVTVPAGKTMWVYNDGTNVVDAVNHLSSLTLGTDLAVADGGTGASTFTANGIIYGNTTSALLATAAGTTGQVLVGNTGGAPSWATLTGIGVTSFSGGTTGLTPASPTTGAITLAGTLGVANGGTGTATAFTAGSVVFAGASGVYSQDNTNLFWDDTNNRLGIGISTPTAMLTVNGTGKVGEGVATNTSKFMVNTLSGVAAGIQLIQDANESWIIQNPASTNVLTFSNSGTERMRLNAAGDLGIGTATPGARLETSVTSAGATVEVLRLSNPGAGANTQAQINFATTSTSYATITGGYGAAAPQMTFNLPSATAGNYIWQISGTERMRIDSSGNVGIGTSAPSNRLHVYETASQTVARFESTLGSSFITLHTGSAQTFLGSDSTGAFLVQTPGSSYSTKMFVGAAGNVGIGTSSPIARLDLGTPGNTTFLYASNGVDSTFGVSFATNATTITNLGGSAAIAFATGATERMRITDTGNVGIGTASPTLKLDVNGSIAVSAVGSAVTFDTTGAAQANYISTVNDFNIRMFCGRGVTSSFTAASDSARIETNGSERMRITSAGDVGINTSSPSSGLDVNAIAIWCGVKSASSGGGGNIRFRDDTGTLRYVTGILGSAANTTYSIYDNVAAIDRLVITSAGNVGVGTTSPNNKLQSVYGVPTSVPAAGAGGHGFAVGSGGYGVVGGALNSGNAYLQATRWDGTATNYDLLLQPNGGNVGIGTTSPVTRLEVVGNQRITKANVGYEASMLSFSTPSETAAIYRMGMATGGNFAIGRSDTATTNITLDSSGNVGIGTSSPGGKLEVLNNGTALRLNTTFVGGNSVDLNPFVLGVSNDGFSVTVGGNIRQIIDGSGNVGIGTTTPSYPLEVRRDGASSFNYIGSLNTTATGAFGAGFLARAGSGFAYFYMRGDGLAYVENATANPLGFSTNGSERMRIDSSGNLLVGTTSATAGYLASINGALTLGNGSSLSWGGAYNSGSPTIGGSTNFLAFYPNGATSGETMRITSAGNVGIGTSSPAQKLEINGGLYVSGSATLATNGTPGIISYEYPFTRCYVGDATGYSWAFTARTASTNYDLMVIQDMGNVGIGTTNPTSKLFVEGTIQARSGATGVLIYGDGSGAGYIQSAAAANPLIFQIGITERMRIDGSGNLLVGTTSANGSMANTATTNSGVFNTLNGTVSAASGAATTIATANQNYASATYIVSCSVSSGAPDFYSAVAIVSADNNVLRITNLQTATNMTISISGTNIQATQTSGGTTTIIYSLIRIG